MNRRGLLVHASAAALIGSRVRAQPLPIISDTVPPWIGSGPLSAAGAPLLNLDFMSTPGTLDPRVTFTRGSTATYFDNTGTMQTVSGNTPRWDYNPSTLALRGLLIEEARSNVAFNSANFTGGGWAPYDVTLVSGQPGAPDGTAGMTRVVETTANTVHYVPQAIAGLTASTAYTFSAYARAQQNRYLQLSFMDGGNANGGYATFDLQAGVISGALTAVGAGVIGIASIQPIGGGTYRCAITTTIGANTSGTVALFLSNIAAPAFGPGYAGNASNGLLIWGAQLEQGAFPTSYIPTTAAAVTRAAEVMSLTDAALFLGANGKTVQVEGLAVQNMPSAQDGYWVDMHDSGSTNVLQLITPPSSSGIRTVVYQSPTTYVNGADVALTRPTVFKAALANSTVWNSAINGSLAPGSGGASAIGTGAYTVLHMGSGSTAVGGYIRRVRFWQRALSSFELQSVTR